MSLKVLVSLSCMKSPFCGGHISFSWAAAGFPSCWHLWRGPGPVYGHLPGGMGLQGAVGGALSDLRRGTKTGRSPNKNSGPLELTSSSARVPGPRKHQSIAYSDWTLSASQLCCARFARFVRVAATRGERQWYLMWFFLMESEICWEGNCPIGGNSSILEWK